MSGVSTLVPDRLKSFIERIERLEEEKKGVSEDIREVFAEAKSLGYDVKVMRQVIKLRKMDPNDRTQLETEVDLYMQAVEGSSTNANP